MTDPKALAIPLAFVLISALLCWHVIAARGKWWLKLALIVIVPSFALIVWTSLSSYQGWPTAETPPDRAVLLWGEAREPDPRRQDAGTIYLWLVSLDDEEDVRNPLEYVSPRGTPRAYKLPYSRPTHEMLEKAREMIRQGQPVVLERNRKAAEDGEPTDRRPLGQGRDDDFRIYELPPPKLPPKDPEP